MPSVNNLELEHMEEGQGNVWSDAIPMLEDKDHRIRNRGVNILLHRLSHKSKFQLLQTDQEAYREGFELLLERAKDKNYSVRMFAVTTLAVVLEAAEGKEEHEDIYQIALAKIVEAMKDDNLRVSEHAIEIVQEMIKEARRERRN
jgi:hypothetical protein